MRTPTAVAPLPHMAAFSAPAKDAPYVSPLAAAIQARPRPQHVFDVAGVFSVEGVDVAQIAFRAPVKAEDQAAIVAAHEHVFGATAKMSDEGARAAARTDAEILTDEKLIQAIWRSARWVPTEGATETSNYPAFPSPTWMRDHLTTEQLAYLLNLTMVARDRERPGGPRQVEDETVEAVAKLCAENASNDAPDVFLATRSRQELHFLIVRLSEKLAGARESVETLLATQEALGDAVRATEATADPETTEPGA